MKKILVLVLALPLFGFNCTGPVDDNGNNVVITELCDGIDNDENGRVDDGIDCDGDGYCAIPVDNAPQCMYDDPDCNDRNTSINPGATEVCNNGIDDDCDGDDDEGCDTGIECTDVREGSACSAGAGACTRTGQWLCPADTATATCNAVAGMPVTEVCNNGIDDDCDGSVDEGCVLECTDTRIGQECFSGIGVCRRPGQWQCTDNNVSCNAVPGTPVTEVCGDSLDNDCDGSLDEGCALRTWYRDADNDTYGNPAISTQAYTKPPGYVENNLDCNDADPTRWNTCTPICTPSTPNETGSLCSNGVDDDCDGFLDAADPGCAPVCLPLAGGSLRVELASNVVNACTNRVIIVWGPGGSEHRSTPGSSVFQQSIGQNWQGYVRVQILCNPTNVTQAGQAGYWEGQLYAWPSIGSKPSGVAVTFDSPTDSSGFIELGNQQVINGPMSESWLPACQL